MFAYYSSHSVQCTLIVQYAVDKMLLQGLQSVSESKLGKCPETLGYEPFVHASAAPENLLASPPKLHSSYAHLPACGAFGHSYGHINTTCRQTGI